MTPLRRRMIVDMKLENLSPRTIEANVSRVGTFARYFGRSPQDLERDDVRAYLLHLIQKKKVSWSVYNQTLAALRFLSGSRPDQNNRTGRVSHILIPLWLLDCWTEVFDLPRAARPLPDRPASRRRVSTNTPSSWRGPSA